MIWCLLYAYAGLSMSLAVHDEYTAADEALLVGMLWPAIPLLALVEMMRGE